MQEVLENVSKETGASHKRIAKVMNENLDKFDDGKDIYKFVAHQCKGIENDIGLCWGISLMQFISPLSESLEFDDIREPIIKYCPLRKNTDLVGGGISDQVSFMVNVALDVQNELGENYIKIFKTNTIDYYIKEGLRPGLGANYSGVIELPDASNKLYKKTNFLNFYNFNENFLLFMNNKPTQSFLDTIDSYSKRILKKYNVKSMYLSFNGLNGGPGHALCIRQCNSKIFIFNDDVVTELKNISLFDVMENPDILKLSDDARLVNDLSMNRGSILSISAVLLKNKNSDNDVPETNYSKPSNSIELLVDTKYGKRNLYFSVKHEENTTVVDLSKLNILSFKNQSIPIFKYSSIVNLGYNKFKKCDFILPSQYETLYLTGNENLEKLNIKNYYHIKSLDLSDCPKLSLFKQEFPPEIIYLSLERNYLKTEDIMKINFPKNIRMLNLKYNKLNNLGKIVNYLTGKYKELNLIDISNNHIDLLNGEHRTLKLDRELTIVYEKVLIDDEEKSKILENLPANLEIDFEANY